MAVMISAEGIIAPSPESPTYRDSLRGVLWGTALGDYAGRQVLSPESSSADDILEDAVVRHELLRSLFSHHITCFTISQDTQLTLFTLDALTEVLEWNNEGSSADELACLWLAYLRWYRGTGRVLESDAPISLPREIDSHPALQKAHTLDPAISRSLNTGQMQTLDKHVCPDEQTTGALAPSAVFGFLPLEQESTVISLSARATALTHGHPETIVSSIAYTLLIRYAIAYRDVVEQPIRQAVLSVLDWIDSLPQRGIPSNGEKIRCALRQAKALSEQDVPTHLLDEAFRHEQVSSAVLGRGVLSALVAENREEVSALDAIAHAVRVPLVSDSSATVTGALLGAGYGSSIFSPEFTSRLEVLDVIDEALNRWCAQLGGSAVQQKS
ncbi:ADP-ribosylglycohydrolase family protein [Rothia sp. P7181]|uniref:ADP-ribosylglycohydrolase family protein n=2 Tax=unclassified Rothia (in: high G+C Gram-positive bacteria) TaxID=2689056 RepID=UPI003AEE00EE